MFNNFNKFMILLIGLVAGAQIYWWYPALPDLMPSHFDASGEVDREMAKSSFIGLNIGLYVLFLIVLPIIGKLMKFLPDSAVNVPNKEYWLANERRAETLGKAAFILNFTGWVSGLLFIGLFQLSAMVAVNARQSIAPEFHWLLVFYLALIFGMVGFVMIKFRVPAEEMQNFNRAV